MQRITSFSPGVQVPSATLNSIQDQAMSMSLANKNNGMSLTAQGLDSRLWLANSGISNGTILTLDTSQDWHDRAVPFVVYQDLGDPAGQPGGADDAIWGNNGLGSPGAMAFQWGFLGKGAQKSGGGQVATASPPVPAFGTSWAIRLATTGSGIWLYVDTLDGSNPNSLKLYNNSGGTITMAALWVCWSAKTGTRT